MKKLFCLIVLALLVSACGEEQKSVTPATSPATKPMEQAAQKVAKAVEPVKEATQQVAKNVAEQTDAVKTEAKKMVEKAETKVAALAGSIDAGKAVYEASCGTCHNNGIMGAPKLGDERLSGDLDTLYKNSINGVGRMPAKGGISSLSDDKVKAAVDYMVEQSR